MTTTIGVKKVFMTALQFHTKEVSLHLHLTAKICVEVIHREFVIKMKWMVITHYFCVPVPSLHYQ